jgi:hypothetical protein
MENFPWRGSAGCGVIAKSSRSWQILAGLGRSRQALAGPSRFGRRQQNRLAGVQSGGVRWVIFAKDQSPKVGKRVGLRCMLAE